MRTPFLLLVPVLLWGCQVDEIACDDSLMASVSISVTDLDGNPVSPTTLTYTVDGGEEQEADCLNADCSEAAAGWEVPGEFEITGTVKEELAGDPCCWYDDRVTETLVIEQGECHVDGQPLSLMLDIDQMICADTEECG